MKIAFFIAIRYFFSKKKHNVINLISMICVGGIAIVTTALICILSVYNGFQNLISGYYNIFDPDLRITLYEGKTFKIENEKIEKLKELDCVAYLSTSLEDNVLIKNKDKQVPITIKGVSDDYKNVTNIDSIVLAGRFTLGDKDNNFAILGGATMSDIGAGIYIDPVLFYAPRHGVKINLANPEKSFSQSSAYVSGVYITNQREIDSKFAFVSLPFAYSLLGYSEDEISVIEIKLNSQFSTEESKEMIQKILGNKFKILDKFEQHDDFYKMLKIEKWITFLILFFILTIAVINVAGSLTMLIIEKKNDINILSNIGMPKSIINKIFLFEGWLVSFFGMIIGLFFGLVLCLLQSYFGILSLNNGDNGGVFLVDAYPVDVQFIDIITIIVAVLTIGFIIAWIPTRFINKYINVASKDSVLE